jgi:hypothetical protein
VLTRRSARLVAIAFHATRARRRPSPVPAARSFFRARKRASPSSGVRRSPGRADTALLGLGLALASFAQRAPGLNTASSERQCGKRRLRHVGNYVRRSGAIWVPARLCDPSSTSSSPTLGSRTQTRPRPSCRSLPRLSSTFARPQARRFGFRAAHESCLIETPAVTPLKTSAKKEMRRRHLLNHVQKPVNSGLLPEVLVSKEPHVFQGFRASGRRRPHA